MAIKRFTVGSVEDEARLILLDTHDDAYRFEPKEVYQAMKDGLLRIRRERPVSRYVGGLIVDLGFVGQTDTVTDVPAVLDAATREGFRAREVTMEERWKEAVVYYVVHRMYQKDDPDTTNANLAQKYLELYANALGG